MAFNRPFQLKGLNDSVIFTVSIPSSPVEAEKCNKKRKMGEKKKRDRLGVFCLFLSQNPNIFTVIVNRYITPAWKREVERAVEGLERQGAQ